MLVEFSYQNYMSFSHETMFSMVASNTVRELEQDGEHTNVVQIEDASLRLLKVGAIYGANASGKSNFISAISFFKSMVLNSFLNERLLQDSFNMKFLFVEENRSLPTAFEIVFIVDGMRYRYGFEVDEDKIVSEWLYERPTDVVREKYCFTRENGEIKINPKTFKGAARLQEKTRDNALFLSTTAQFNVETSMRIKDWFVKKLHIVVASDQSMQFTAHQFMNDEQMRRRIVDFIKLIDLGINNMDVKERKIEFGNDVDPRLRTMTTELAQLLNPDNPEIKRLDVLAQHNVYDGDETVGLQFLPFEMESLGTNKIFSLLGPWFECLKNGGTLIVDEFGASLHTHLSMQMIRLFQSKMNNSRAQLILTTHDTNLLRKDLLRRDQIWFVEKNKRGESDMYSLVEYKINQAQSVRNDASYQKDYLVGKYGAIPYFGNIDNFIADYSDGVQE